MLFFSRSVDRVTRPTHGSAPHIRGWLIVVAAVVAGLVAGFAAANATGPFSGLRPYVASNLVKSATPRLPIDAGALFPSPSPPVVIHQMVPIYYRPATAQSPSQASSSDDHPRPSSSPRPSPSPGGGDDGGGGGDN